jgi:hypothetical protein
MAREWKHRDFDSLYERVGHAPADGELAGSKRLNDSI